MDSDKQNDGNNDAQQDKWGDLLSGLGIEPSNNEPPQETPAMEQASAEADEQAPQPTPVAPVEHAIPARPASGWNDLASDFGLEVTDPEPEPPVAATVDDAPAESTIAATPQTATEAEPEVTERGTTEVETPPATEESVAEPVVVDQAIREVEIEVETEPKSDGFGAGLHAEQPEAEDASPAAAAGFGGTGLTLPDWFPFGGRKKNKQAEQAKAEPSSTDDASVFDDSDPTPGPDDTAVFVRATPDAAPTDGADLTGDAASEGTGTEEGEESEDKPKRSRRRRGRRRGRGRGRGKDTAENSENSGENGEVTESAPAEAATSSSHLEADSDHDDEDLHDDETGGSGKSRSISHKNIPAWQEAIGVVVDSNIAARGQRKRSNSRGRGGSRGGRGRGRRRTPKEGGSSS